MSHVVVVWRIRCQWVWQSGAKFGDSYRFHCHGHVFFNPGLTTGTWGEQHRSIHRLSPAGKHRTHTMTRPSLLVCCSIHWSEFWNWVRSMALKKRPCQLMSIWAFLKQRNAVFLKYRESRAGRRCHKCFVSGLSTFIQPQNLIIALEAWFPNFVGLNKCIGSSSWQTFIMLCLL